MSDDLISVELSDGRVINIRRYNLGKFDAVTDEFFCHLSLDGCCDYAGGIEELGWHASRVVGPFTDDAIAEFETIYSETLTDDERAFIKDTYGATVTSDDRGFVSVHEYDHERDLTAAWEGFEREEQEYWDSIPSDDDYIIGDKGNYVEQLKSGFEDQETALRAIAENMRANQFFPNVWIESDHGNLHRVESFYEDHRAIIEEWTIEIWKAAGYLKWTINVNGLMDTDAGYFDSAQSARDAALEKYRVSEIANAWILED